MPAVFVTASGTDIGKTFIAEAMLREWRAQGHQVAVLKPVISGDLCWIATFIYEVR